MPTEFDGMPIKYPDAHTFADLFTAAKVSPRTPGSDWFYIGDNWYVQVRPEIQIPQFAAHGKSSLQALRLDGGQVLVVAIASTAYDYEYVAYLDNPGELESLL